MFESMVSFFQGDMITFNDLRDILLEIIRNRAIDLVATYLKLLSYWNSESANFTNFTNSS